MSDALRKFLTDLGADPEIQAGFRDDPKGTMLAYQLDPEVQKAILDGDKATIEKTLGGGLKVSAWIVMAEK